MSRVESPPPPSRSPLRTAPLLLAALGLALMPWLVSLFATGSPGLAPREIWTSSLTSVFAIGFGLWVIVLLRRERQLTRQHLEDLEALTVTDPLTALGNRRGLERDLTRAMLRSRRLDHPLALLFMDVDDLKLVNDRFGHAAGDDTLRVLANVVRACSREGTDSGFRVGGDEFVLIVLADRPGAEILAGRIHEHFQSKSPYESTLSLGVVEWDGTLSSGELINEADRSMYQNKHMGRPASHAARNLK